MAAKNGHFEIVKYLVENHVDKESKDWIDQTPLHNAAMIEIVKYLVEKGANIQAKTVYGETPLDIELHKSYCAESQKENFAKIIQFLRERLAQK